MVTFKKLNLFQAVALLSYVIMCIANFFHYTFTLPWLFYFILASLYQVCRSSYIGTLVYVGNS